MKCYFYVNDTAFLINIVFIDIFPALIKANSSGRNPHKIKKIFKIACLPLLPEASSERLVYVQQDYLPSEYLWQHCN